MNTATAAKPHGNTGKIRKLARHLFAEATRPYVKLCLDYPDSGGAHNQLAWTQVECHRDLDDALVHAKRAAELQPRSTAILDTLAEVQNARGQYAEAVASISRCVELEPWEPHHRKQLERFKAALERGPGN